MHMKLTIYVANKTFLTELAGRYRRPVVNKWELATCPDCQAIVWNAEAVVQETRNSPRRFNICCQQGRIKLPPRRQPPSPMKELLQKSSFKIMICVANGMLAFTSTGGQIDNSSTNSFDRDLLQIPIYSIQVHDHS
ncbi:hypothetical protein F2Q70_00020990 [Brassica cretica]|uniref:Uncharacterized protein n=2 Tax=Brassica cretica TaxID=69181 RepID=A0A8S9HGM1_BRACR|nr:hypothetical protein F2Q70_00020990 [Brassica cretica]KAF2557169.1 hypothetical protein F2Q68_00014465 [Brassica cretica]KAF3608580.1 hypothetical protein DY000_02046960 [Brassica cretica]